MPFSLLGAQGRVVLDDTRRELERQVERLLEEAEKPMTVEEMIPHLNPIMPGPNDVADVLEALRAKKRAPVEREGSYYRKPTPVPVTELFAATSETHRDAAEQVVDIIREMDREGDGAPLKRLVRVAGERGVPQDRVLDIVARLKLAGEVYQAVGDRLHLTKR